MEPASLGCRTRWVSAILVTAALCAGCASSPTPAPPTAGAVSPSAVTTPAAVAASSPAVSATAAPEPPPTLAASTPSGFTTPRPPAPDASWTSITWQLLAASDPLAQVRSMTRWHAGYVAVGAITANATDGGATSSTPVWVSADGASWAPLDRLTFGPDGVVVSISELPTGLVALALHGGPDSCPADPASTCWRLAGPLSAWTSTDGMTWTQGTGPTVDLPDTCDGDCGVDVPIIRTGAPGLLVVVSTAAGQVGAISADGVAWDPIHAVFPGSFEAGDVVGAGTGFVAVGSRGGDTQRAAVATSPDGRTWTVASVPTPGIDAGRGTTMYRVLAGPGGLLALGSMQTVPDRELWWTSGNGASWTPHFKYPPLGVWTGGEAGSGLLPDGTVLGNGDRLVAYRNDGALAGWTSSDGAHWQPVTVTGATPAAAGSWPILDLTILPVGLLWVADDGTTWLGAPGG